MNNDNLIDMCELPQNFIALIKKLCYSNHNLVRVWYLRINYVLLFHRESFNRYERTMFVYARYLLFDESLVKIPLTVINYSSSTTSFTESELNNFLLHVINLNEKLLASFLKLD